MLDPGDEVIVPAPYWTTYPEAIQLAGGVAVACSPTRPRATRSPSSSSRRPAPPGPRCCCSSPRPTRRVRSTPPTRSAAIGRWADEHGLWVLTDEIYEHLVYDGVEIVLDAGAVPDLADTLRRRQRRRQDLRDDRLAGRLDDRARPTSPRPRPTCSRTPTSNVANVAQRAALAAVTGDLSAVDEMRAAFDRRRKTIVSMLNEIEGVVCPTPEGAFYAYPSVKGLLGKENGGRTHRRRRPTSPSTSSSRPRSRSCPARRSGHRATCGCPTRWATTTWSRASPGCRSSSPDVRSRAARDLRDAAQGSSAPALHRLDAPRDAARARRRATASSCPTRW